jgi:hypothetical protein
MTEDRRSHDPFAPPPPAPVEVDEQPDTGPDQDEAAEAAAQIPSDLDDITKPDLVALAELAGVATYGTKAEIAARIREAAGH